MNVDQLGDVGRSDGTGSLSETVEPVQVKNYSNLIWLGTLLAVTALVAPASERTGSDYRLYPSPPLRTGMISSSAIDDKALDELEKAYEKTYGASRQD